MKIYSTKFKGLKIIKYNKYRDERGDVIKIFNKKNTIFKINCFESYLSFSKKGTVRGLHGQSGKYSSQEQQGRGNQVAAVVANPCHSVTIAEGSSIETSHLLGGSCVCGYSFTSSYVSSVIF